MARSRLEVRMQDAVGRPRAFRLIRWRLIALLLSLVAVPAVIGVGLALRASGAGDESWAKQLASVEEEKGLLLGTLTLLETELGLAGDDIELEPLIPLPTLESEPAIGVALARVNRAVAVDGVALSLNGKPTGGPVDVWWMKDGLGLAGGQALPDDLTFTASSGVVVGGIGTLPGSVRLAWTQDQILVINDVPMERYLEAVVSSEVPDSWSLEAKKAQSVAARSYALARLHRQTGPFAVESSTLDQVYRLGMTDPGAARAVDATRGQILSGDGVLVEAYYHSNCAGHTEAAAVVWPERGAIDDWSVPCDYCGGSPSRDWQHHLTLGEMGQAVAREHPELATITSLELLGRTGSDRVRGVQLAGPEGALLLTGNEFRRIFGYTRVRSTWFDIDEVDGGLQLTGRGSGHGVGMCQWGAQGMSREGMDHEAILAHYYGGATLHTAYE